jgi:hypothetical protein
MGPDAGADPVDALPPDGPAAAAERAGTVVEPAAAREGGVADVATARGVGEFSPVPGAPGIPQTSQYPSVMVPVHPGC